MLPSFTDMGADEDEASDSIPPAQDTEGLQAELETLMDDDGGGDDKPPYAQQDHGAVKLEPKQDELIIMN